MSLARPIRVLIVDDSAMIRKVLHMGLSEDSRFDVVGTAARASIAEDMINSLKPDVITLDIEMPKMNGIDFLLSREKSQKIPTVIISSHTPREAELTIKALEAGAVDVIEKPAGGRAQNLTDIMVEIRNRIAQAADVKDAPIVSIREPIDKGEKVRSLADKRAEAAMPTGAIERDWLFAMGASTGGVQALAAVLPMFPREAPGIVIVQHMPGGFTKSFADRLDSICQMSVKEAEHGDEIRSGQILLAPGGEHHMVVRKTQSTFRVHLIEGDPVCFSRPSVDVLFESVAREVGSKVTAAILTGMGKDGARGMKKIRDGQGRTFAQDEASCTVFGMPRAAHELDASEKLVTLNEIPTAMMDSIGRMPRKNNPVSQKISSLLRQKI